MLCCSSSPDNQPWTLVPLTWLLWNLLLLHPHHSLPLIPNPQSCSHSQYPCNTSACRRSFMAYRTGSFQKKAVESGVGIAFFYPKKSEKFICSKKTYSILELSHQLPWFSNRFLESAPVCLWPLLFRNCNCFPGLLWRLQLWHLPGPLGSTFMSSVPKREQREGALPRLLWAPTPGSSPRACQHFHKAIWDYLHLHCQAACPGVPTLGLHLFSLWTHQISRSRVPVNVCCVGLWMTCVGKNVASKWSYGRTFATKKMCSQHFKFLIAKNFNKSFDLGTFLHTVLYT